MAGRIPVQRTTGTELPGLTTLDGAPAPEQCERCGTTAAQPRYFPHGREVLCTLDWIRRSDELRTARRYW